MSLAALVAVLDRHPRLAFAVSGGVDSMTLAHVAMRHSSTRATMYHATSPAVPAAARERVEAHAVRHGWALVGARALLTTSDGGSSWSVLQPEGRGDLLLGITSFDSGVGDQ